jgi:uncharacterized membrane protein YtjA (UPF0391 family)
MTALSPHSSDGRLSSAPRGQEDYPMLYWTVFFLIIALVAGLLGFTGIAVGAAEIAKFIFLIFLALFIVSLIASLVSREPPPAP